ncbi:hypothetical protein VL20_1845 [Microcystis panniformis FACHB-1757]|uniref:Uncharacterized protein n=1 Tax=Microcystis panniformis FACHB-1757 TaxID=1638788 RepID=A0A0K1RYT8_9CHRO|nr:hypothetical protein VL20_1845 [Microcystis panniformis FACHB-1757]
MGKSLENSLIPPDLLLWVISFLPTPTTSKFSQFLAGYSFIGFMDLLSPPCFPPTRPKIARVLTQNFLSPTRFTLTT